jgi:transcription termination factor Rho
MYDILQLNDMLVPELLDIAEQQQITDTQNLQKQELIYKILDKQASMTPNDKKETTTERPKRKRIAKPTAKKPATEEVVVAEEKEIKPKKAEEKKKPIKKAKEEVEKNR